ncbi:MAG TPA: carbohydrate kinase family protein [Candidatus Bathyarchaeota archaeon]|nr:carbohydrate kinase family protein [Candidatus Bathyarchaeota archaeon]
MKKFDVIGFGALNVDKLFKVNKIASADEEGFIIDCEETCGGSAANTIVGLARLGCKVGFIGKVAYDREGKMLTEDFRKEGVDQKGIICSKHGRSGTVMGFVDQKGERALYVDPGVNDTLDFNEIDKEYAFKTRFLHLTSFVGEKSFKTQMKLVEALPSTVKVSLDPGELYARKGLETLEPFIKRTFVLMPNRNEVELLTKKKDYKEGARVLLEKGVKIVAVKLGSQGCYVTDGKESHHIEAFKVKVVDTTGAGDAFCAGFLYGLIRGKNLYDCGRIGNFVASRCIMRMGARPGLPHFEDLKVLS